MAYALDTYTGDGSQTDFNITFPYINEDHVKVYVNFVNTSFTFEPNKATARLASAPANGIKVEIRRITPLTGVLVDYADGSTLTAGDLDTSNLQHLYNAQELDDTQKQGISIDAATGQPTLNNQRLTNVTDPSAAQDAATKNYVDTTTQPVNAKLTELATMGQNTANALADLTQAEVQILDGATVNSGELNLLDGVTATTAEINYVDGVTSNVQTQLDAKQPLDAELTELATMSSDTAAALADLTQAEVQLVDGATLSTTELNYVDGVTSAIQTQLDGKQPLDADLTALSSCQSGAATNIALLTSGEIAVLDGATLSTNELNTLTGITSTAAELNKLDGVTSTTANLNVVSGMTKATSLTSNSDTELPTSKAVADHVSSVVNALGGFVAINGPTNFPTTQPAQGVVVSIKDVGSGFTTSSNEITITNGAGTNKNVRITGFPSEYAAATLVDDTGLQVTSDITNSDTSSTPQVHRYVYHKQLAKESDVKSLSDDINDFNARYRVVDTITGLGDNDEGDLVYAKDTDKMMVYDATTSAYKEVQSVGSFNINTLSSYNGTGGNSASFNGTAYRFVLSNPPTLAQQLICSVNGVLQKPNTGTGQPSEGFAIAGSSILFSAAPANGADFFIITLGSAVNVATVSDEGINEAKLHISNAGTNGQFLQKQSGTSGGLTWADAGTFTTLTEDGSTGDLTVTGTTGDSNTRNIVWDKSATSLSFDDWTYLKFRTTNNSDSGACQIYSVGSSLRISTTGMQTDFWGEGIWGRNSISGWSGDWFYVGTNNSADDQTKLYNGRNSKVWQSKTWGAEYVTTGAVKVPNGTEAQRPTATKGQIRYNTDSDSFEGYQGSTAAWSALGGGASANGTMYTNTLIISDDVTIAATEGAHSVGPITNNATVTVNGRWVIS